MLVYQRASSFPPLDLEGTWGGSAARCQSTDLDVADPLRLWFAAAKYALHTASHSSGAGAARRGGFVAGHKSHIKWWKLLLVGGLEHVLFFHILGIIIPTDYCNIFQRGWKHQPGLLLVIRRFVAECWPQTISPDIYLVQSISTISPQYHHIISHILLLSHEFHWMRIGFLPVFEEPSVVGSTGEPPSLLWRWVHELCGCKPTNIALAFTWCTP